MLPAGFGSNLTSLHTQFPQSSEPKKPKRIPLNSILRSLKTKQATLGFWIKDLKRQCMSQKIGSSRKNMNSV